MIFLGKPSISPTVPSKPTEKPTECYDCGDNNPCTTENLKKGLYYHTACDPTQFVQCGAFGRCFMMDCPPDTTWDQDLLTCT